MNASVVPCYVYDEANPSRYGDCCDEYGVSFKPIYYYFFLTFPVEVFLAHLDVKDEGSIGTAMKTKDFGVFVVILLCSLGLIIYRVIDNPVECRTPWECYQGVVFLFANSSALIASLTLCMRVEMKRQFTKIGKLLPKVGRFGHVSNLLNTLTLDDDVFMRREHVVSWAIVLLGGGVYGLAGFFAYLPVFVLAFLSCFSVHMFRLTYRDKIPVLLHVLLYPGLYVGAVVINALYVPRMVVMAPLAYCIRGIQAVRRRRKEKKDNLLRSKEIDKQLRRDHRDESMIVKIVLLGQGNAGKTTILRQLRSLFGDSKEDEEDLFRYALTIKSNIVTGVHEICDGLPDDVDVDSDLLEKARDATNPVKDKATILQLWNAVAKEDLERVQWNVMSVSSMAYFIENLDRIARDDYVAPTHNDLVHMYLPSKSITECPLASGGVPFSVFDVGGARSERKKWIHCFDNVTAVVFVVALDEYCEYNQDGTNKLKEALTLFGEIANSRWFKNQGIIVFFNKQDTFRRKLGSIPLSMQEIDPTSDDIGTLEDYGDFEKYLQAAHDAIRNAFIGQMESNQKYRLKILFTNGLDPGRMQLIWDVTRDTILRSNLQQAGFLGDDFAVGGGGGIPPPGAAAAAPPPPPSAPTPSKAAPPRGKEKKRAKRKEEPPAPILDLELAARVSAITPPKAIQPMEEELEYDDEEEEEGEGESVSIADESLIVADIMPEVDKPKRKRVQQSYFEILKKSVIVKEMKKLVFFDAFGYVIIALGPILGIIATLSIGYSALFYAQAGLHYVDIPEIDWNARNITRWVDCQKRFFDEGFDIGNAVGAFDFALIMFSYLLLASNILMNQNFSNIKHRNK